ncbi:SIMPL domain-containing protein [Stakelama sp. CBK3Z-3]|uniref:SIMPL domain-containing protein n=1 Tax=Stakelama flava TaxID=2860338 RepID=A0ABS6XKT4_9SPHN|nr:SIMPL domain-containing protein [Stakelama flava]MBW4330822.1 SIMPL domain-containing protein [Stakelama flava]
MRTVTTAAIIMVAAAPPALAQEAPQHRTIVVQGHGSVKTKPDVATIAFSINGEGKTADAAAGDLAAKQKAVLGGIEQLFGGTMAVETGNVQVQATRAGNCDINRYSPAKLAAGECLITGYVASLDTTVRTAKTDDAATATGLAGRLGAINASVRGYDLQNDDGARKQATRAALADARNQAEAIAQGSGVTLGDIITVSSPMASPVEDIVVTGARAVSAPPPPPPPPPPPVRIDTSPAPIETHVTLNVVYAIRD